MLPPIQKILFLIFAAITGGLGLRGFYRLYRRIAAGRTDTDARFDHLPRRIWYALVTTLTQSRTFRKRRVISIFHSFIFYGFTFYLLVNLIDAIDGFVPLSFASLGLAGNTYVLLADVLSALVLIGAGALVVRRFVLPSRIDFCFNERTMLHHDVKQKYVTIDSLVVSSFILFHVGSRALGAGAKLAVEGPDRFAPFATLLSHFFTPQNALLWRIFGYWGALGSVLAFLVYFPYSKHIHIFMAPAKYFVSRSVTSGVLPAVELDMEAESPKLGAEKLEDLAWPRLLDAYACIQCNRCQDVCPATATGKSLSPSALEINKRMELNEISKHHPGFEKGQASPSPLLGFVISPEAAWACTTCGACIDICPVGDEPMLDIIDIRRQQVMMEGQFPAQLQTTFRGMERSNNPWGISHEKRLDWAEGLNVKTTEENPKPDVLFWVGCAASYDPQSQKTARAFVQLLDHAGVDFAVLGKRECCTGDAARRSGNEYLYRQLADTNVATLNEVKPKLIVATCPHCMNTVGKEYKQLGGDHKVMHHTEYLETLVASGRLVAEVGESNVAYHDPCYLGRHNGVYDAPRNLLNILSNTVVEMPRNRENSFCCGAGGAQFWKEEEPGSERISDNRYREAQQSLAGKQEKVLAVGCPFCKSMLESTPVKGTDSLAVRDVAELLLEGVQKRAGTLPGVAVVEQIPAQASAEIVEHTTLHSPAPAVEISTIDEGNPQAAVMSGVTATVPEPRKKWKPKTNMDVIPSDVSESDASAVPASPSAEAAPGEPGASASVALSADVPKRKSWAPKRSSQVAESAPSGTNLDQPQLPSLDSKLVVLDSIVGPARDAFASTSNEAAVPDQPKRKAWVPKRPLPEAALQEIAEKVELSDATEPVSEQPKRKPWIPKRSV
jgi:Fe-S oxidoreductase